MEQWNPTVAPSVTNYIVRSLLLDWTAARISVVIVNSVGDKLRFEYQGAKATTLMTALNKANLSLQSLHSRILNQLVTDGFLPTGAIVGVPD